MTPDQRQQYFRTTLPVFQISCEKRKLIGEEEEKTSLAMEQKRIKDVSQRHKELHPPLIRECPVCLDDIEMIEHNSMIYFYCCGYGTCYKCFKQTQDSDEHSFNGSCPLCRSSITSEVVIRTKRIMKCAERGMGWAQCKVSQYYRIGNELIDIDEKKSLEWLLLSSENDFPDLNAIRFLAQKYEMGCEDSGLAKSKEKAIALYKRAADLGNVAAQDRLAILFYREDNWTDAIYYATLATENRPYAPNEYGAAVYAAYVLGMAYHYGKTELKEDVYLARHYFQIAVEGGFEQAGPLYGEALISVAETEHRGMTSIPGYSPIPKALYWFRKAANLSCEGCGDPNCWKEELISHGTYWTNLIESKELNNCSLCGISADDLPGKKNMKQCGRCKGAWYCSRECQVASWPGHKNDCVKPDAPMKSAFH